MEFIELYLYLFGTWLVTIFTFIIITRIFKKSKKKRYYELNFKDQKTMNEAVKIFKYSNRNVRRLKTKWLQQYVKNVLYILIMI